MAELVAQPNGSDVKRQRVESGASADEAGGVAGKKRVGTHNGTFHCDEALGCFMLRLTSKYKDADIIRTRGQEVRHHPRAALAWPGSPDASDEPGS